MAVETDCFLEIGEGRVLLEPLPALLRVGEASHGRGYLIVAGCCSVITCVLPQLTPVGEVGLGTLMSARRCRLSASRTTPSNTEQGARGTSIISTHSFGRRAEREEFQAKDGLAVPIR
jgi:hypothetical protein